MSLQIKKPTHLNISYLGIEAPSTPAEIEFELAGLETVISEAKHRIAQLKQAVTLANLASEYNK